MLPMFLPGLTLTRRIVSLAVVWIFCCSVRAASTPPLSEEEIIRGIDQAHVLREEKLGDYSVTERYSVRNDRFGTAAGLTVAAVFRRGEGKTYRILERSGSTVLQARVLEKLLKEEAEMSHGPAWKQSRIISTNYKMKLLGPATLEGRECYLLELVPRIKNPHVLKGRVWVDAKDFSLVRIEGRPEVSPSFLAGRPKIVREYQKIEGLSFAKKSDAVSESLLFGKTELIIDYSDYRLAPSGVLASPAQPHP